MPLFHFFLSLDDISSVYFDVCRFELYVGFHNQLMFRKYETSRFRNSETFVKSFLYETLEELYLTKVSERRNVPYIIYGFFRTKIVCLIQARMNEDNLKKQEVSVHKQEAMRRCEFTRILLFMKKSVRPRPSQLHFAAR
jgi:hypothetical protein